MGFLAMKGLSGGLITNARVAYAYLDQPGFEHVEAIWGVQRERELDEFLACMDNPPAMEGDLLALIEKDKQELSGNFCRGCGYCSPCPVGIEIFDCARMSLMIRRAPSAAQLTEENQARMKKIADCIHCNACVKKCPYGLNPPKLLEENYKDYMEILAGKPL